MMSEPAYLVAATLGAVLVILALLHVHWAIGGVSGGAAVPSRSDGTPIFRPGPLASLSVAAALTLAAAFVLARGHVVADWVSPPWILLGTWGVAAAFALRTIGEFRYVGVFRRVRDTSFARWDARVFTPLCAVLALGAAWLALN